MHLRKVPSAAGRAFHTRPTARPARLVPALAGRTDDVFGNQRRTRRSSASNNPSASNDGLNPATQLANNPAGTSPAAKAPIGSSSGSTPSPAVQQANNLADQQTTKDTPPSVQVANNLASGQPQQTTDPVHPAPEANDTSSRGPASRDATTPADVINQGIRAAANTAEDAITQTAAAAVGGIAGATNLTTQGVTAAEQAAEDTARNLADAAEGTARNLTDAAEQTITTAATVVGGVAGAVDGTVSSLTDSRGSSSSRGGSTSRRSSRPSGSSSAQSPGATGSFDSVNVRVPSGMAWANATPARGSMRDVSKTQDFDEVEVEDLKVQILAAVASLDRGLAANLREAQEVDRLCQKLEDTAGPLTLKWSTSRSSPDASTMDRLAGTWRLIYSSGFNGGSLGGSRPGPPAALVPTVLGQVYQVIDADQMLLDNVVELLLNYGAPQLPFLPRPDPQPTPGVRITLRHTYDVTQPNTVTIVFESTAAKAIGPELLQNLPQFGVPELPDFLKPPKNFRSASFDVSYLDASMRITRGDRGELRVYLRDKPLTTAAPADYLD